MTDNDVSKLIRSRHATRLIRQQKTATLELSNSGAESERSHFLARNIA